MSIKLRSSCLTLTQNVIYIKKNGLIPGAMFRKYCLIFEHLWNYGSDFNQTVMQRLQKAVRRITNGSDRCCKEQCQV